MLLAQQSTARLHHLLGKLLRFLQIALLRTARALAPSAVRFKRIGCE
jgi:hypothetical protein